MMPSAGYRNRPPRAGAMIEALRGLGYSTATALADLVDNSIAADARCVDLQFVWAGPDSHIIIQDDGRGMDDAGLDRAMRLGHQSPLDARADDDLGRFGLGLKTASFSQCRRLTVASRQEGGAVACLRWDLDVLASSADDTWRLLDGPADGSRRLLDPLHAVRQGTRVLWENLDRIVTLGCSEQNHDTAVKLLQAMLQAEFGTHDITPSFIAGKLDWLLQHGPQFGIDPDRIDRQATVDEMVRRFSLWIGHDTLLTSDTGHEAWLVSARKEGWRYWPRYRDWLDASLPAAVIDAMDRSTDTVLGLLEDPLRQGAWDRRGLVVGNVQSGKTGHYIGLVPKAADAGYKIVIVLAGLHNNLRSQTQRRLDEGFLGYETTPRAHASPHFASHQITPKTSRYTRCSMSMLPNVAINGRIRSSGQLGRWWYSISPCRNNECVRRFTVFAFNQRS